MVDGPPSTTTGTLSICGMFVVYALAYVAAKGKGKCRATTADVLVGFLYYPAVCLLAVDACYRLRNDRWDGTSWSSHTLGVILASRMIVHVPYLSFKKFDVENWKMYIVHHVMVIVVYGGGVLRQRAHFYGAVMALCEMTNIFLTIEEFYLVVAKDRPTALRSFARLGLLVSYPLTRLILFPVAITGFLWDAPASPERRLIPVAMVLVFAMSLYWALNALHSGAWGVFRSSSKQQRIQSRHQHPSTRRQTTR